MKTTELYIAGGVVVAVVLIILIVILTGGSSDGPPSHGRTPPTPPDATNLGPGGTHDGGPPHGGPPDATNLGPGGMHDGGPPPADCQLGEWHYSQCDLDTCEKTGTRDIRVPARGGGTCWSATSEERQRTVPCGEEECPCTFGPTDWSPCAYDSQSGCNERSGDRNVVQGSNASRCTAQTTVTESCGCWNGYPDTPEMWNSMTGKTVYFRTVKLLGKNQTGTGSSEKTFYLANNNNYPFWTDSPSQCHGWFLTKCPNSTNDTFVMYTFPPANGGKSFFCEIQGGLFKCWSDSNDGTPYGDSLQTICDVSKDKWSLMKMTNGGLINGQKSLIIETMRSVHQNYKAYVGAVGLTFNDVNTVSDVNYAAHLQWSFTKPT